MNHHLFLKYWVRSCLIFMGANLLLLGSCTKYRQFEAVFPPKNNSLANYQKIVVMNQKPGDHLYDLMENALKAQLTAIYPGNLRAAKSIDQINKDMEFFNYNPKIQPLPEHKIAYITYNIRTSENIKRQRSSKTVFLRSCNNLLKQNRCRNAGTARAASGLQSINLTLSGEIFTKDGEGKEILPVANIRKNVSDSGKLVKSSTNLTFNAVNAAAYDYTKNIIPHKRRITSEILRGGDAVSAKLIEHGAYNQAINRLDKVISESENPDYEDFYNLGLAYEALSELQQALDYYNRANDREENQVVQIALRRVRRIIGN